MLIGKTVAHMLAVPKIDDMLATLQCEIQRVLADNAGRREPQRQCAPTIMRVGQQNELVHMIVRRGEDGIADTYLNPHSFTVPIAPAVS
jgi:hypothetical protein